jgi:guanine nucleotide-binding protein G(i) subunit alpha
MMRMFRSAEATQSNKTTKQLEKAAAQAKLKVKLLLLGAGGTGKTTLRKQLQSLYGTAFQQEEERREVADIIVNNLLEGARAIVMATFDGTIGDGLTDDSSLKAAAVINNVAKDEKTLTAEVVDALRVLGDDPVFQRAIALRSKFQLQECVLPFFQSVVQDYPAWGGPQWIPSKEDCVRARIRSSGVIQADFTVEGVQYSLFDAGGQRAERRKWIHHFDDVTALIYMASLTDYDEVLYEDASKNRLQESLEVFEDLQRSHEWQTLLFLNKLDLFKDKYTNRQIPLNASGLFPYAPQGNDNEQQAIDWMATQYKSKMLTPDKDAFYVHSISAVDSTAVEALFEDAKMIVLWRAVGGIA